MKKETYLGDGVYALFDGYHIWLRTERENGWHEIALEPAVFYALVEYRNEILRSIREARELQEDAAAKIADGETPEGQARLDELSETAP